MPRLHWFRGPKERIVHKEVESRLVRIEKRR